MYTAEIRDELGCVESAATVMIPSHVACFYREHGVEDMSKVTMKQHSTGNIIASYTYTKQSPLMVEGEGAPQYTMFDLPKDTQLALL